MPGTISIDGKAYPCKTTAGAMLRFKNLTAKDATKIDGKSFSDLVTLLYCCVSSACKREGVDFTYDLDTFADYLDLEEVTAWATDLNEGSKKKMPEMMK